MDPAGKQGWLCGREPLLCHGLVEQGGYTRSTLHCYPSCWCRYRQQVCLVPNSVCCHCHQKSFGPSRQSPPLSLPTTRDNALTVHVFQHTHFPDPTLQSSTAPHIPVTPKHLCNLFPQPPPQFQPLPHFLPSSPGPNHQVPPSSGSPAPGLSLVFSLLSLVLCSGLFPSILPAKLRKDLLFHWPDPKLWPRKATEW